MVQVGNNADTGYSGGRNGTDPAMGRAGSGCAG